MLAINLTLLTTSHNDSDNRFLANLDENMLDVMEIQNEDNLK